MDKIMLQIDIVVFVYILFEKSNTLFFVCLQILCIMYYVQKWFEFLDLVFMLCSMSWSIDINSCIIESTQVVALFVIVNNKSNKSIIYRQF